MPKRMVNIFPQLFFGAAIATLVPNSFCGTKNMYITTSSCCIFFQVEHVSFIQGSVEKGNGVAQLGIGSSGGLVSLVTLLSFSIWLLGWLLLFNWLIEGNCEFY